MEAQKAILARLGVINNFKTWKMQTKGRKAPVVEMRNVHAHNTQKCREGRQIIQFY